MSLKNIDKLIQSGNLSAAMAETERSLQQAMNDIDDAIKQRIQAASAGNDRVNMALADLIQSRYEDYSALKNKRYEIIERSRPHGED